MEDRLISMNWWNQLSWSEKCELMKNDFFNRNPDSLTGREIEIIHKRSLTNDNITSHPDFNRYFDSKSQRNYWILGYFGGGSLNVNDTYDAAKLFSKSTNTSLNNVFIDEIFYSRRFRGFKYIYSKDKNQKPEPDTTIVPDLWEILND